MVTTKRRGISPLRFRAHKERQAVKERVYQAMLKKLGSNEALAREVHTLWCEQEKKGVGGL